MAANYQSLKDVYLEGMWDTFGFVREGEVVDGRGFDYGISGLEERGDMRENGEYYESSCQDPWCIQIFAISVY